MNNETDVRMSLEELRELLATLKRLPSTPALRSVMEKVAIKLRRLEEQVGLNLLYGK